MAYAVVTRRREIGIRMALGAGRAAILAQMLRRGLAMTSAGLAVGLLAVGGAGRLLASELFQVRSSDPLALGATAITVVAVATLALLVPAARAAGLDPATVLRAE
jgi:putative ABC transport system permease protein